MNLPASSAVGSEALKRLLTYAFFRCENQPQALTVKLAEPDASESVPLRNASDQQFCRPNLPSHRKVLGRDSGYALCGREGRPRPASRMPARDSPQGSSSGIVVARFPSLSSRFLHCRSLLRFSAAERRQRVAWGVSPRKAEPNNQSPEGATANLIAQFAGAPSGLLGFSRAGDPGLTPRAICCRAFGTEEEHKPQN